MAVIDSKKLLPPAKSSGSALATQKFLVPISNIKVKSSAIIKASDIKPVENTEDGGGGKTLVSEVLQIRKNVISIQRVIASNTTLLQKSEERKRKLLEKKKFSKREQQLEKKDPKQKISLSIPSLPRTGFLDAIKRFLFYTLLGAAFVKFGKHIPKILEFSKKLIPAFKFLEDFAGNVLNGVVDFVGAGYKAYDKVREITKKVGGEDAQKKFDEFSKQFNTFANLAIIAGMATMGGTDFGGDRRSGPGRGRRGGDWRTEGNVIKGKGAFKAAYDNMLQKGNLSEGEKRVVRDYKRLVKAGYHPDSAANEAFFRNSRSAGKVRGGGFSVETAKDFRLAKAGRIVKPKAILGTVKPLLKRLPIIGALIDFGLSVALGEDPGRAAFKSIGAGLLGSIGTAVGSLVFGFGGIVGGILGSIGGDAIGGALYDTFFGGKKPQQPKGKIAKAEGGGKPATRGGRKVSGPTGRAIKSIKSKPPKVKPQKTIPGKDVGGRKKIAELFYDSPNPNQKNPLGVLETTSESLKKVPLLNGVLGAVMGIPLDLVMGQKPDASVFKKIGYGFGALVQNTIDAEASNTISNIQKELVGLAGGGSVPRTLTTGQNIGMQIGERLARTLEVMINAKVSETLQSIRQQFSKEGFGFGPGGGPGGGGPGGELDADQQEAFEKIRKIAEKVGSPNPSITAAIAMIESGWLANPNSIYFASGKTNPFGQSGRGPKGSVPGRKPGQEFAIYNNLEEGVKAHVDRWGSSYIGRTPEEIIENIRRGAGPGAPGMYNNEPGVNWTAKILSAYRSGTQPKPSRVSSAAYRAILPEGNPQFSSGFGIRNVRWGSKDHKGIDISVDRGSRVLAAADGIATVLDNSTWGSFGQAVVVDHGDGTSTLYGHVDPKVKSGQRVKKGDTIAKVKFWPKGAYGAENDDNTHLHFERRLGGVGFSGRAVDPSNYLNSLMPKPSSRPNPLPASPVPSRVRTNLTRSNQWNPSQSGLILKNGVWQKASTSIAPTSPTIASGVNQWTQYGGPVAYLYQERVILIDNSRIS